MTAFTSDPSNTKPWFMSAGLLGLSDVLSRAVSWVGFVYLVNIVNPEVYGLLGMASSVITILLPFVDMGLGVIGTREAALPTAHISGLFTFVTARRMILSLGFVVAIVFLSGHLSPSLLGDLVLGSSLFLFVGAMTPDWIIQARERFGVIAFSRVIQSAVYLALLIFFVRDSAAIIIQPVIAAASFAVGICVMVPALMSLTRSIPLDVKQDARISLRSSWNVFIGTSVLQNVLPLAILGVGLGSTAVEAGWLNAASRFWFVGASIAMLPATIFFPRLVRARALNNNEPAVFQSTMNAAGHVAGLIMLAGLLWSQPLVELLSPTEYHGTAVALAILCIGLGFQVVSHCFGRMLIAHEEEGNLRRVQLIGAVAGIVSIPVFSIYFGSWGGALSCVVAEACVLLLAWKTVANRFPHMRTAVLRGLMKGLAPVAGLFILLMAVRSGFNMLWQWEIAVMLLVMAAGFPFVNKWNETT